MFVNVLLHSRSSQKLNVLNPDMSEHDVSRDSYPKRNDLRRHTDTHLQNSKRNGECTQRRKGGWPQGAYIPVWGASVRPRLRLRDLRKIKIESACLRHEVDGVCCTSHMTCNAHTNLAARRFGTGRIPVKEELRAPELGWCESPRGTHGGGNSRPRPDKKHFSHEDG